jgi:hypothetical protein
VSRRPIHIDPARLEEAARAHSSQLAVSSALDISQTTLVNKLLGSTELRRAYERGRSARAADGAGKVRKAFSRSTRLSPVPPPPPAVRSPAPAPVPAPAAPRRATGNPSEMVVKALGGGGRTYGELMNATGLDWHRLVAEMERLARDGRVRATEVGGRRRHFLVVQKCGCGRALAPDDIARKARDFNGGLCCYDCYSRLCEDAAAERDRRLGLDEDDADMMEANW